MIIKFMYSFVIILFRVILRTGLSKEQCEYKLATIRNISQICKITVKRVYTSNCEILPRQK